MWPLVLVVIVSKFSRELGGTPSFRTTDWALSGTSRETVVVSPPGTRGNVLKETESLELPGLIVNSQSQLPCNLQQHFGIFADVQAL